MKSERVADRDCNLSDTYTTRIAEPGPRKRARIDPENRQVGVRIVADQIAPYLATIRQRDRELVRAMDDVAVRQHKAVGREDHTRAAASPALDSNDGRGNGLNCLNDGRRIRIEQFVVVAVAKWSGGHDTILGIDVGPHITRMGCLAATY
jgi:hypothetical protein